MFRSKAFSAGLPAGRWRVVESFEYEHDIHHGKKDAYKDDISISFLPFFMLYRNSLCRGTVGIMEGWNNGL